MLVEWGADRNSGVYRRAKQHALEGRMIMILMIITCMITCISGGVLKG